MNYKLTLALFLLIAMISSDMCAMSRKKKKNTTVEVKKQESAYDRLFKKQHVVAKGLITLHRVDDKLYFELPLTLLGKDMLLGSTVTEISDNGDAVVGSKPKEPLHIQFTKIDSTIQLRQIFNYSVTRDEDVNIARAIEKANIGAIIGVYKIEAYNPDSTAVVIDMTKLFVGDNKQLEPIDDYGANTYGGLLSRTSRYQSDKSFLGEIKAFEDNVIIRSHLSYLCDIRGGQSYYEYQKPLTVVATRSLILLPEKPARPRMADPRVGVFPTGKIRYTNTDNRAKTVYYANRWRIEPADEAAFRAGKLVEPKKPIIFYIDNNFPAAWIKYIRQGVEDWNLAFEAIGFKNVVQTRLFPTDDPEFDPDNIKYSCVRYAPTWMANAMGPSWTDPRTGEIINASVYVYHNLVSLVYNWRLVQTSAVDPKVRVKNFTDEMLGESLRYVASHEIGHCLGFMHNMGASSAFPTDSLRSASFTQKYGTTPSIMDYARNNYVAQPGDEGVRLTPPVLGVYDYFAVKWNYAVLPDTKTKEEEAEILSQWVTEKANDPMYRYGKQQIYSAYDPSALSEDLGDDAMKSSNYGIKNLKYTLSHLNEWFVGQDKDYSHRAMLYNEVLQQYLRYINHVFRNIGGIYLNERYEKDPVDSYATVPREKQRRAVKFLLEQVHDLEWIENKELLVNLPLTGSPANDLRKEVISYVVASVGKLPLCVAKTEKDPYTPTDCMADIYNYVWAKTLKGGKLTAADYGLQTAFVEAIVSKGTAIKSGNSIMVGFTADYIKAPEYVREKSIRDFGFDTQLLPDVCCLQNQEVGGVGYQMPVALEATESLAHVYYGFLMKTKNLLERNIHSGTVETRNHYRLLLRRIEKALK